MGLRGEGLEDACTWVARGMRVLPAQHGELSVDPGEGDESWIGSEDAADVETVQETVQAS